MGTFTAAAHSWSIGETVTAANMNSQLHDLVAAFGAWTTYTPATTNLTLGSGGTLTGRYCQIGKTVWFQAVWAMGTGGSVGSSPTITAPVTSALTFRFHALSRTVYWDSSASQAYFASSTLAGNSTTISLFANNSGLFTGVSSSSPFTWAVGDEIQVSGFYEAA